MNETVMRPDRAEAAAAYVARVREALADLPADDADDLVGGLAADLAERAAELPEGTDLANALGEPSAYAAELRSAAGLPPMAPPPVGPRPGVVHRFEAWLRGRGRLALARWPWLADLRATWWLVRGGVLVGALALTVLIGYPFGFKVLLMLAGAALSFVWGRRGESPLGSAPNRLAVVGNAFALLFLLPVATQALAAGGAVAVAPPGEAVPAPAGVWVDGESALSLYAYDAAGNRVDRVRLFTQYGQAVSVDPQGWEGRDGSRQPPRRPDGSFDVDGSVFPVRWGLLTGWEPSPDGWDPPLRITPLAPAATPTAGRPGPVAPVESPAASTPSATGSPGAPAP